MKNFKEIINYFILALSLIALPAFFLAGMMGLADNASGTDINILPIFFILLPIIFSAMSIYDILKLRNKKNIEQKVNQPKKPQQTFFTGIIILLIVFLFIWIFFRQ